MELIPALTDLYQDPTQYLSCEERCHSANYSRRNDELTEGRKVLMMIFLQVQWNIPNCIRLSLFDKNCWWWYSSWGWRGNWLFRDISHNEIFDILLHGWLDDSHQEDRREVCLWSRCSLGLGLDWIQLSSRSSSFPECSQCKLINGQYRKHREVCLLHRKTAQEDSVRKSEEERGELRLLERLNCKVTGNDK